MNITVGVKRRGTKDEKGRERRSAQLTLRTPDDAVRVTMSLRAATTAEAAEAIADALTRGAAAIRSNTQDIVADSAGANKHIRAARRALERAGYDPATIEKMLGAGS